MTHSCLAIVLGTVLVAANQPTRYDAAHEVGVSGTVRYVISTVGLDGTVGVHLDVQTTQGLVHVHAGPAMFIGMNNFWFLADDRIQVVGSRVTLDGETAVWARQIVKDGKTLVLRNEEGKPLWPNADDDFDGCGVAHAPIR